LRPRLPPPSDAQAPVPRDQRQQSAPLPVIALAGGPVHRTRPAQSSPSAWPVPAARDRPRPPAARYSRGVRARSQATAVWIQPRNRQPNKGSDPSRHWPARGAASVFSQSSTWMAEGVRLAAPMVSEPAGGATAAPVAAVPNPVQGATTTNPTSSTRPRPRRPRAGFPKRFQHVVEQLPTFSKAESFGVGLFQIAVFAAGEHLLIAFRFLAMVCGRAAEASAWAGRGQASLRVRLEAG